MVTCEGFILSTVASHTVDDGNPASPFIHVHTYIYIDRCVILQEMHILLVYEVYVKSCKTSIVNHRVSVGTEAL